MIPHKPQGRVMDPQNPDLNLSQRTRVPVELVCSLTIKFLGMFSLLFKASGVNQLYC